MKEYTVESLGVDVKVSVPSTVEEYNDLAKRGNDAVLDDAIGNIIYRSTLARFRDKFVTALIAHSGIPLLTKVVGKDKTTGADISEVIETELKYVQRVCLEKGVEAETFQSIADEVCRTLTFDPSSAPRVGTPKKTPQVYLDAAKSIIDKGADALSNACAKLGKILGITVTPELEPLAKAIQARELAKRREQEKQLVTDLVA